MTVATTKEVRKAIKETLGLTPICTDRAVEPDMRLICFRLRHPYYGDEALNKVQALFKSLNYENRVKVTSEIYLRIKAIKA